MTRVIFWERLRILRVSEYHSIRENTFPALRQGLISPLFKIQALPNGLGILPSGQNDIGEYGGENGNLGGGAKKGGQKGNIGGSAEKRG